MGPDAMIFVFWMLSFKPAFSLSTFTFIKSLFSSSSLSAIRVVSSAYLRLLIFLLVTDFSQPVYRFLFDGVDHNKLWKILKEMGIPDHLTCLLRDLYAGQEATVRTGHGTTDWFQIGKGVGQGCILSPCLLTCMQSTSWEILDWKKHKLKSRLLGEISITSDMQMTPPLWQKVKRS